jgi:hypothetical protein
MPDRGATVRAAAPCPLCRDGGRLVMLEAELERDGELLVVVALRGCRHANRFGNLERLTVDEEWRLIDAAHGAYDAAATTAYSGNAG